MKNLVFNTQICTTIEQSKRLLEFGLDVQTSDCYHYAIQYFDGVSYENTGKMAIGLRSNIADENHFDYLLESFGLDDMDCFIPAWSLHRLIAMLPDRNRDWLTDYCDFKDCSKVYDEVISLIEWMIENEYFNKEYLKEE
jgi:hypothetical protein